MFGETQVHGLCLNAGCKSRNQEGVPELKGFFSIVLDCDDTEFQEDPSGMCSLYSDMEGF